jgi:prophage antirepressor-like protein
MNELQVFDFEGFRRVRVIIRDGAPWFVAKDVCDILEIENSRDTLAKMLDEDEKGVDKIYTPGGEQEMNIVNESGLYNLIFRSNKPVARAFRKWVTSEVLPSIRKTGRYTVPEKEYTTAEIEIVGKSFFMECYRKGGVELYLEKRYPDEADNPRVQTTALKHRLTAKEKHWIAEAELAEVLTREGRL